MIGAGRFGTVHCEALQSIRDADLRVACTRNLEHQSQLQAEFPDIAVCAGWPEIVADDTIDAVTIATHWQDHFEIAIACLRAGKHVLLEKPMAASYQQCLQLLDVAQSATGHFMVGHICRFDPRVALAREAINAGKIGRVVSLHAKRNLPVAPGNIRLDKISPLMGDGIHDADLMMWFLGAEPTSIYARNVRVHDFAYPDIGWAMLHFEQSEFEVLGVIETNWALPDNVPTVIDAQMEVVGTTGKLTIDCANTGFHIA